MDIAADTKNIPLIRAHMKGNTTPPPLPPKLDLPMPKYSLGSPQSESSPFMKEDMALDTPQLENMLGSPGTPGELRLLPTPSTPTMSDSSGNTSPTNMDVTKLRPSNSSAPAAPSRSKFIEVRVLFWRTAQNILRHRSLLVLHVVLSLALALFGGLIFNHVTNDLAGFQNRSGAFYFILTFFGFASMSSMDLFIAERTIFLRETGAMYYGAFTYFLAKATLDMLLLRVFPATLFAR